MIGDIVVKELPSKVLVNEKDDEENVNPKFIEWEEKDVMVRSWLAGKSQCYLLLVALQPNRFGGVLRIIYLQDIKDKEFQLKQEYQNEIKIWR